MVPDPNSVLSPYLPNKNLYHCPADNYVDQYAGGQVHVRSYSMNSAVGTIYGSRSELGAFPLSAEQELVSLSGGQLRGPICGGASPCAQLLHEFGGGHDLWFPIRTRCFPPICRTRTCIIVRRTITWTNMRGGKSMCAATP